MEAMTTTAVTVRLVLTLSHRCDQCRAQAFTGWANPAVTDDPLLLCAHHANEHEAVLLATGWEPVADERKALLAQEAR